MCRPPSAVRTAPGLPSTVFSQILDVSERVQVERDLAESEARYRRILETTLEGVWTLDADDVTTFANRAMAEILDTEPAAMIGRPLSDFLDGTADLRHGGHRELSLRSVTGRPVWALVAANPMLDADGTYLGALAMVTDITDRKMMEVRLQHLADHDHLTGIFNRRRLLEELDEQLRMAARTGRGGAALVVDLDHFKFINDTHGHVAGDTILRTVGEVLRARLRSTDVVARLGGDEFAMVLPEVSAERAMTIAHELRHLLAARDSPIAASIGVVEFTGSEELTADEILVCADTALYEAKERGGAQARLYTGQATGALRWVQRIRTALEEDRLVLHGQPILDLRSGQIAKHELLVRMLGDDGELIAPGAFLPTAERFGLIREIDAWVTRQGLLLASAGRAVTINLSGYSVTEAMIESLARGARDRRAGPGQGHVRDHRDRGADQPRRGPAVRREPRRPGLLGRARRLRHRLRLVRLPQAHPGEVPQDRHGVRARPAAEPGRPGGGALDRRDRPQPRQADDRRGRRGRGHARAAARVRRRLRAGLRDRPPRSAAGLTRLDRRSILVPPDPGVASAPWPSPKTAISSRSANAGRPSAPRCWAVS